jgi:3D (Asp-Asp-Asp) domain-containing protein
MLAPRWRLVGSAAAGAIVLVLPIAPYAATTPKLQRLRTEAGSIERQKRSAVLSLYSLDSRVSAAFGRLALLQGHERVLRAQRTALASELRLATIDAKLSQRRLASRVRALYDHGSASTLEVIFGAHSLTEALTELDNINSVATVDDEIVLQVRTARVHELKAKRRLAVREARLAAAIEQARSEAQTLEAARSQRSAYVATLASRQALDLQAIARLDSQARAAEAKAHELTKSPPAATVATPLPARTTQATGDGNTVTVVSTGYCLTGTTSTGLPVGWGVAAVDPSVIPLGTHLTIPGYGSAVAADTGPAIAGARIDLWFPTCAQAGGWGTRSVTIALH